MTKREMANQLRKWSGQGITYTLGRDVLMSGEIAAAAADALEREAEREEQERKKVTLAHMAEACSYASGLACGPHVEWLDLAADTLLKLDEEGGHLLRLHFNSFVACTCGGCVLARSLGVEKKP